jgi:hypothetical protein
VINEKNETMLILEERRARMVHKLKQYGINEDSIKDVVSLLNSSDLIDPNSGEIKFNHQFFPSIRGYE